MNPYLRPHQSSDDDDDTVYAGQPLSRDISDDVLLYEEEKPRFVERHGWKLAALALCTVALTLWVIVRDGEKANGDIAVIAPPTTETRIKPEDPQGMNLPHQNMLVYQYVDPRGVQQPQVERLIPAPAQDPRAALPQTGPATGNPAATAPLQAAPVQNQLLQQPAPSAGSPIPLIPAVRPAPVASTPPQQQATATPAAQPPVQVVRPLPRPAPAPAPVAPPAPAAAEPAAAKPAPAAAPAAAAPLFRLQLAALKDEAAAQQAWTAARTRSDGALNGLKPDYVQVEIPGKGTYFRVQAGAFKTRTEAQQLCAKLKQAGQDCMVVQR